MKTLVLSNVTLCIEGENVELTSFDQIFKTRRLRYEHTPKRATIRLSHDRETERYQKWFQRSNNYGRVCVMSRPGGAHINIDLVAVKPEEIGKALASLKQMTDAALSHAYVQSAKILQDENK